jgi:hypothetical protein
MEETMPSVEIVPAPKQELVRAEDFMPLMTVAQAVDRKRMMNEFIASVMTEGEDFGFMPGDSRKEKKKVLLKPGAEKLCSIFGLAPRYVKETIIEDWTGADHGGEALFYYEYRCQLYRGDRFMGEGIGSANTWEEKYRWRDSKRTCPACGSTAIIKGKEEYGGGWLCYAKKGGCGAKFADNDPAIVEQKVGREANPNPADLVNTVQKMAQKRAQVAAVLVVTNCSDAFTQDLEDLSTEGIDTGGHAVGTQAAADHVRDQKLANAKKPEPEVPGPLKMLIDNLRGPNWSKYVKNALMLMKDQLETAMPELGAAEARRIAEKYKLGAGSPRDTIITVVLEMYEVAEFARAQAGKLAAERAGVTDAELPEDLFNQQEVATK